MKSILVVDDSDMARTAICFALKTKNYQVIDAKDGKDALVKIALNKDIGLIITDVNMPEMNGLELIAHIREVLHDKTTPIYALTTDEKAGKEVVGKGATGYLLKTAKTSEEVQKIVSMHIVK
jgi:two-component system, chemotaxis family, chemotaxis protein CheY